MRTKLPGKLADKLADICCDACLCLNENDDGSLDLHMVEMIAMKHKLVNQTRLAWGVPYVTDGAFSERAL
jgi:T-complex protein 1 subunit zeta